MAAVLPKGFSCLFGVAVAGHQQKGESSQIEVDSRTAFDIMCSRLCQKYCNEYQDLQCERLWGFCVARQHPDRRLSGNRYSDIPSKDDQDHLPDR
jgi:hypothetical protein